MLCYVFERQVKDLYKEFFFLIVLCLVFTPLIGYQVSLVDSPIRRLSMVAGILDDHLTTEERCVFTTFCLVKKLNDKDLRLLTLKLGVNPSSIEKSLSNCKQSGAVVMSLPKF